MPLKKQLSQKTKGNFHLQAIQAILQFFIIISKVVIRSYRSHIDLVNCFKALHDVQECKISFVLVCKFPRKPLCQIIHGLYFFLNNVFLMRCLLVLFPLSLIFAALFHLLSVLTQLFLSHTHSLPEPFKMYFLTRYFSTLQKK